MERDSSNDQALEINFCFDHESNPGVLGYPNLAQKNLQPDDFDIVYPRTLPCRLFVYFSEAMVPVKIFNTENAPDKSWYPIALGWHDFNCDYISLIPKPALDRMIKGQIKILFYYHEGDNPFHIKKRIDDLCKQHKLPENCYLFVSANTKSSEIENFYYFPDHEFFFRYLNRRQIAPPASTDKRPGNFTALSRTHKWWRASIMADLHRSSLLENSLWSYNTSLSVDDRIEDNPIQIDVKKGWTESVQNFITSGPYVCDSDDHEGHNDHRNVNLDLYTKTYCHLVIETLFDADQSGGAFLTEKTYKCLKYGQPFVIVGTPGSLQALRDSGYKVFDHCIDNSYDTINENTLRWLTIKNTIADIKKKSMHEWYLQCLPDLIHNQKVFINNKQLSLTKLLEKLCQHW